MNDKSLVSRCIQVCAQDVMPTYEENLSNFVMTLGSIHMRTTDTMYILNYVSIIFMGARKHSLRF